MPLPVTKDELAALLAFVDSKVPGGGDTVWLTGSRARPDSDWDVLVIMGWPAPLAAICI